MEAIEEQPATEQPPTLSDLRRSLIGDIAMFSDLARTAVDPKQAADWALAAKNASGTALLLTQNYATTMSAMREKERQDAR